MASSSSVMNYSSENGLWPVALHAEMVHRSRTIMWQQINKTVKMDWACTLETHSQSQEQHCTGAQTAKEGEEGLKRLEKKSGN